MRRAAAPAVLLAAALLAPAPAAAAGGDAPAGDRPNIVFILIDTLRADHLPFYGYDLDTAPFLARLAEESVLLEKAYAPASSTAPSCAAMFTSLYPEHNGVVTGQFNSKLIRNRVDPNFTLNRIPEAAVTLGEVMKAAGYATYGISDNYNVSGEMGFDQGFDRFLSNPEFYWGAERINERLEEWSQGILGSEPYFLYIHYIDPHSPYHRQDPWHKRFLRETDESGRKLYGQDMRRARFIAKYDSEIAFLDRKIRRMHRHFGWDRDTILILTSDHGEEFYEHGGIGHGKTLHEEVLRVPLLVRDTTGRLRPRRIVAPVSLVDVLPTLAELVGQPEIPLAQGRSLLPLMEGAEEGEPRHLFGREERHIFKRRREEPREQDYEYFLTRTVLHGEWKLIVDSNAEASLYRKSIDPGEHEDVMWKFPGRAADLSAALHAFVRLEPIMDSEGFGRSLTPEELERLKTLGYVE